MKKRLLYLSLSLVLFVVLCLSATAAPLKVYLFAGQSNMEGSLSSATMDNYDPAIRSWINDASNPVLYHYWKSGHSNATWGSLDNYHTTGWEHVAAYRLYNYWQSVDTNINVAIFTVSQGATSLINFWTAGGRDREPWKPYSSPFYHPQGSGYQTLTNRLTLALQQLDSLGYTNRDVEAFFWYQGEGDSFSAQGGDNYRILFEDLVYGWENRSTNDFPNDTPSEYGGSLRSLLGLTNLPAFVARISWQIKGSSPWGARSVWEPNLRNVREALVDYTRDHPDCGWVDVDDIPLADLYHYSGENYCEIGDRMVQTCMETLYAEDNPYVRMLSPLRRDVPATAGTVECEALATDASGAPIDDSSLTWISSEEGVFGSGSSAILTNASWETRVTSVGSAAEGSNTWKYTTNLAKRIQVKYTDPNGNSLVKNQWIQQEKRKLYIRCNASFWAPGNADDSRPATLFGQVAEWGGHPTPVAIEAYNPELGYSNPAFPAAPPDGADPSEYKDYDEIFAEVSNRLATTYSGENLAFVLYSSHSNGTTDETGGAGTEDRFVSNAVGWAQMGQAFNPKSELILYEPWARYTGSADWYPTPYLDPDEAGTDIHNVTLRAQSAVHSNSTAGIARITPNNVGWAARNWDRKMYVVFENGSVDRHGGDFGHVFAVLSTYANVYADSASAIYRQNPDLYHPELSDDWDLAEGGNGTNDIDDLMHVLSLHIRSPGETNEFGEAVTMTVDEWQELARLADKLVFTAGDANLDGVVDAVDYDMVITNVGVVTSNSIWADGDFDADGDVDQDDMDILYANRGAAIVLNTVTLSIPEGSTNGFLVKLGALPTGTTTVTVSRTSGDTDISVQSGSSLIFTTGNWNTNQLVVLAAAEDSDWADSPAVFEVAAPGYTSSSQQLTATEDDNEVNPNLQIPFSETFENDASNSGTLGNLDGQRDWVVSGDGAALVQTSEVHGGSQALSISNAAAAHSFEGAPTEAWITFWSKPVFSEAAPDTIASGASAVFYVNTNGQVVAYNGANSTTLNGSSVSNDWNQFEIHCDYVSNVWNLSVNDTQVLTNFAFHAAPASFSALEFSEASRDFTAYIDDLAVTDSQGDDSDSDGLPDSWENQYWPGDLSHTPGETASNGVNTVEECYIADISPVDPSAAFLISDLSPAASESVLQWTIASGRVYSVYWASNLLSGFPALPFASNITDGVFTDSMHNADHQGFYKIEVELE